MTRRRKGKRGRTSPSPPAKRHRGDLPESIPVPMPAPAVPQSALVMVAGLPHGCGMMALKSRLQAYGPIARARVDADAATGYVTFRSGAAAVAAISASLDTDGGIAIGSKKRNEAGEGLRQTMDKVRTVTSSLQQSLRIWTLTTRRLGI